MMRRASRGSSIWAASNCIRIPYAPAIWITRTNCALILIPAPASVGAMCAWWPSKYGRCSKNSAFAAGPRPAAHGECM